MRDKLKEFFGQANEILLDKEREIRLALACFLANGHLLIEDVPGVGKTTLVQLFSHLINLRFGRIQFTNDLLPSDILGNSIFNVEKQEFHFHRGAIFAQLILADELNRATPKTQSALLQAMEEKEVSLDGTTYPLPLPFFVVATQNPRQQVGTFPLPESELDRFLMRIDFGYPSRAAEHNLLKGEDRRSMLENVKEVISAEELVAMQDAVKRVRVSDAIVDYVQDILDASRGGKFDCQGLSPRAGLALMHGAKAWAWLDGRELVLPEDVQAIGPTTIVHRLGMSHAADAGKKLAQDIIQSIEVN